MADVVRELWEDKTGNEVSKLRQDPKKYLGDKGVDVPEDKEVQVILEEPGKLHLYIPSKPDDSSISGDQLRSKAAASLNNTKEMF